MATRFPTQHGAKARAAAQQPDHLIFRVRDQVYLLTRPTDLPDWARRSPMQADGAFKALKAAATVNPAFAGALRAAFPHHLALLSAPRYALGDAVAMAGRSIERKYLALYAMGADATEPLPPAPQPAARPAALPPAPSDDVTRMGFFERVRIVVAGMHDVHLASLSSEAQAFLGSLAEAEVVGQLTAKLVAWALANFTPVGPIIDAVLLAYGVWAVGYGIFATINQLVDIFHAIQRARTVAELQRLSLPRSKTLVDGGITAVLAFLVRGAKPRTNAKTKQQEAASFEKARSPVEKAPPIPGRNALTDAATTKQNTIAAETAAPEFITVFRGDRAGTTIIKSNAAREGGYASSQRIIDSNNLDDLFQSHALDSSSPASPFISVTTDPNVARYFAGPNGVVNEFRIPVSRATPNPFNNYVVPAGPGGQLVPEAELLVPSYIRPSEFVRRP